MTRFWRFVYFFWRRGYCIIAAQGSPSFIVVFMRTWIQYMHLHTWHSSKSSLFRCLFSSFPCNKAEWAVVLYSLRWKKKYASLGFTDAWHKRVCLNFVLPYIIVYFTRDTYTMHYSKNLYFAVVIALCAEKQFFF